MNVRTIFAGGACAAGVMLSLASPASAAQMLTYGLGGGTLAANTTSYAVTSIPVSTVGLTVAGYKYSFAPSGLGGHTLGSLETAPLFRNAAGVGVCNEAASSPQCATVDSAGNQSDRNESLGLIFTESVALRSIQISGFSAASTFRLWSVGPGGALTTIAELNPIGGVASPYTIDFSALGFSGAGFALTSFGGNDSGFHVDNVVVSTIDAAAAVPEPSTWALMILGFGSAGHMLRRRRLAPVRAS